MATQENPTLEATTRQDSGKGVARKLRAKGLVPAVCYGQGIETKSLVIDPDDIIKLFAEPKGRNTIFDIEVDGDERIENVMVKSYQAAPVRRELIHVDFYLVDLDEPIATEVPIEVVGRARGEREGGVLRVIRPEIEIKAKPYDIPASIPVEVTEMDPNDTILAEDVELPEGVEPGYRYNYAMLSVVIPRKRSILLGEEEGEEEEGEEEGEEGEEGEGEEMPAAAAGPGAAV